MFCARLEMVWDYEDFALFWDGAANFRGKVHIRILKKGIKRFTRKFHLPLREEVPCM